MTGTIYEFFRTQHNYYFAEWFSYHYVDHYFSYFIHSYIIFYSFYLVSCTYIYLDLLYAFCSNLFHNLLFIFLFVYLFIHLFIYLQIYIYLYIYILFIYLFIFYLHISFFNHLQIQRGHWFPNEGDVESFRMKMKTLCPANKELVRTYMHIYVHMYKRAIIMTTFKGSRKVTKLIQI